MTLPAYPVLRIVAFVLFVIGAVAAMLHDTPTEVLWGLLFIGLATWALA